MTKLTQAPPVSSSVSWWTNLPREKFTETVVKEQQARMSAAKITGRVSIPVDWQR